MNKRCHCGCEFELLDYHLQQRTDTMLFSQAELDNLCHRCWATKVEKVRRWLHNRVGGVMPTPMREAQAQRERLISLMTAVTVVEKWQNE